MKKIIAMIVMSASTLFVNAQQVADSWSITPRLGLGYTFAEIKESDGLYSYEFNGATTASLGAQVRYQVVDQLGVSVGMDFCYMETGKINDCKYTASLIELPILFHYDVTPKFGLFAGAKMNFLNEIKFEAPSVDIKLKSVCQKTTLSIPVGIQLAFNKPWTISMFYNIATQSVVKKEQGLEHDVSFNTLMATIGYRFDL